MSHCLNHNHALPSSLLLTYLTKLNIFSYPYLRFNIQYLIITLLIFLKKKNFSGEIKGRELSL